MIARIFLPIAFILPAVPVAAQSSQSNPDRPSMQYQGYTRTIAWDLDSMFDANPTLSPRLAMGRKEMAKRQAFLDDSTEFLQTVREISLCRFAPPEEWAYEAIEKQADEIDKKADKMIQFLLGERVSHLDTDVKDRSFRTKLSALSSLSARIEFRLAELESSDVVDVSMFQQLIEDLVIVRSLSRELEQN